MVEAKPCGSASDLISCQKTEVQFDNGANAESGMGIAHGNRRRWNVLSDT